MQAAWLFLVKRQITFLPPGWFWRVFCAQQVVLIADEWELIRLSDAPCLWMYALLARRQHLADNCRLSGLIWFFVAITKARSEQTHDNMNLRDQYEQHQS